jgi:hypothetical protein
MEADSEVTKELQGTPNARRRGMPRKPPSQKAPAAKTKDSPSAKDLETLRLLHAQALMGTPNLTWTKMFRLRMKCRPKLTARDAASLRIMCRFLDKVQGRRRSRRRPKRLPTASSSSTAQKETRLSKDLPGHPPVAEACDTPPRYTGVGE